MAISTGTSSAVASCRRCTKADSVITVRTEPLCQDCFCRYAQSKIIKRMESFRVRNASQDKTRTLLLPLSLGASSVALLHILDQYLQGQVERTGRTGFALRLIYIFSETEQDLFSTIKARYPQHSYTSVPLSDALLHSSLQDLSPSEGLEPSAHLARLLESCPSATSKADMLAILRNKLIVAEARKDCECIIWAHNTTRLAEQVLADTAKGRGATLHMLNEGQSPHGIPCYYPCRDLLSSEITAYGELLQLPFIPQEVNTSTISSKQITIDSLMQQYFASIEKDHPSIVANVVRTTAKLHEDAVTKAEQECELCEMPLRPNAPVMSRLCNACIRILPT